MTPAKVTKIIEHLRESYNWKDITSLIDSGDQGFIDVLREVTCDVLKIKEPGEWKTIENNLNRNKTLIRLSTAVFPTEVLESIKQSVDLTVRRKFNYYKFKKNYKS
jgi:hypothetical protein